MFSLSRLDKISVVGKDIYIYIYIYIYLYSKGIARHLHCGGSLKSPIEIFLVIPVLLGTEEVAHSCVLT